MRKWARCNFDGKPISPEDKAMIDQFGEWLALEKGPEGKSHPRWHAFLGICSDQPCIHEREITKTTLP